MSAAPDSWVVWQDAHILVVNKPAGLPTLPDGYQPSAPHLIKELADRFGKLWVVHRLDRWTSGILLLARNPQAHREMNIQFEHRRVAKIYHALVAGEPSWEQEVVTLPLRPNGDRRHRSVVDIHGGKPAITALRVMARYGRWSLLEVHPQTGRTHQIRAHLAAIGHPLAGDLLYGRNAGMFTSDLNSSLHGVVSPEQAIIQRPALHAWSLAFMHPQNQQPLLLHASYPPDFEEALKQLAQS